LLHVVHIAMALFLASTPSDAPFPTPPPAMSQPARWRLTWGPGAGYDFGRDAALYRATVDLGTAGLFAPQFGIGALTAEAAAELSDGDVEAALGAYVSIPWLRAGAEYRPKTGDFSPAFSLDFTPVRGGIFRRGDAVRVDYRPAFKELQLGLVFVSPFERYQRTRPLRRYTPLPDGNLPAETPLDALGAVQRDSLEASLGRVVHAMVWMDRLLTPRFKPGRDFEESMRGYRAHIREPGHTFRDEDARYHRELDRALAFALGDEAAGRRAAVIAERVLFERVIVPYNGLFGQNKKPRTPRGYTRDAMAAFESEFDADAALAASATRRAAACTVFRRVLATVDDVADAARKRWQQQHIFWLRQGRLVWLPVNYGLRPDQYDTQGEVDAAVAALTGRSFTDANSIEYLLNQEFHVEMKRMIRETQSYHVLIIHDFRGRYDGNETDKIGWDVVVDGYIRAFVEAIDEIDRGEREQLPQFLIYLDENFYTDNKSRQIVSYMEHLYDPPVLRLDDVDIEHRVEAAQHRLRAAIAGSPALSGTRESDLSEAFRIHVSVTNPYDPIFCADATMRDHRKIAFRDVTEEDPASGVGIFTGQGVGEHYNGPSWEDRSMMVRGPALVALKDAARRLHLSQGFRGDEVPECLRPLGRPADYAERCQALRERGWTTPLLTVFNDTGYGDKKASVLKATLYNLATRERVIFAFDSLWISDFWAGMFISAALRGAHVFPVAPAAGNAPSSALPTMFLMRETLDIMLHAKSSFADDIAAEDGEIHVGLYAHDIRVSDVQARIGAFLSGVREYPFLQHHLSLDPSVVEEMAKLHADDSAPAVDSTRTRVIEVDAEHKPFIHLKVQFFASYEALKIIERPEWASILKRYIEVRRAQVAGLPNEGITPDLLRRRYDGDDLLTAFQRELDALPPESRRGVIYMLTIGSQNQDRRGMLLDGEVLLAVSGYDSLVSLADMMFIVATARWPSDSRELFELFPEGDVNFFTKASRWIKDLI